MNNTHTLLTFSLCLFLAAQAPLTAQNYAWAKSMGGTDDDRSNAIAVDGLGNIYTTGFFGGTADFDPSAGIANLTSVGAYDIFVSKLDASGNFIWAKSMGGTGSDETSYSIAVDGSGNVYTTGYFFGIVDFDPSAGIANLTSAGTGDIFVSKLDASGNFIWAKSIGSAGFDRSYSIAVDGSGNVYTTGYFFGIVDFDPNAGTSNLTSSGAGDVFVSKLDAAGNFIWAKNMGGTISAQGYAIAVDGSGNVYTTGTFGGTVDFDPNAGTSNLTSSGAGDVFVSKLDAAGNFIWAKNMGGTSSSQGQSKSIAIDGSGNVYTTGFFSSTVDFDPNIGTANLTAVGSQDIFVSKLDALGNFLWAKSMGGTFNEVGNSIAVDGSGNVYTTGDFYGTVDFDPNTGTSNLTSVGIADIFVSKLDAAGNFIWAKSLGGYSASGSSIAVDGSGNVYTTGYFRGTSDFDPNNCITNLTPAGFIEIFVSKLSETPRPNFYDWLGGSSSDWSTAANWSCGIAPTSADAVVIPLTTSKPTLSSDQAIGNLTFSNANQIKLGNFNLSVNTLTGGSNTAYVVTDGTGSLTIKNIGTSATLFPVGPSSTVYAPVTITNNMNRDFSVKVGTAITNPVVNNKYVNLQWDITPSVLTSNSATLALGWPSGSQAVEFNPASAIQVNHYNTTTSIWDISTSATISGTDPYTATASGISSFSPFTISNVVVLPVELVDFFGKNTEGGNLLTWTTANEQNNKGFQIERLNSLGNWDNIGFKKANSKASTYEFTDNVTRSISYYRLRQMDNDGKETLSKVIAINVKGNTKLKIYPSVTSQFLTVKTTEVADYQVFNLLGQQVLNSKTGQQIDVSTLQKGTYIVRVGTEQVKFVKQ